MAIIISMNIESMAQVIQNLVHVCRAEGHGLQNQENFFIFFQIYLFKLKESCLTPEITQIMSFTV